MTTDVAIGNALTFANVPSLLAHSDAIVAVGELDVGAIRHIDSAGVALLLELTRRARHAGHDLRLLGVDDRLRALLKFFSVDTVLNLDGSPSP